HVSGMCTSGLADLERRVLSLATNTDMTFRQMTVGI
nr:hypothetical protein [Tanacetum cinerariifolium]